MIFINEVYAKPFENIYNPFKNINDLSFRVTSDTLKDILKKKLALNNQFSIQAEVYYLKPNKIKSRLLSNNQGSIISFENSIIDILNEYFLEFINWDTFLTNEKMDVTRGESGEYIYKNTVVDSIVSEMIIIRKKDEIIQIIRKPVGTIRTTFKLKEVPWTSLKIIESIKGQEFIGQEVYTYNAVIKYDKVQEAKWMPTLLIINSTQTIKSQKGDEYELERSIGEKLEFSNYIINKNSALEWFSTN